MRRQRIKNHFENGLPFSLFIMILLFLFSLFSLFARPSIYIGLIGFPERKQVRLSRLTNILFLFSCFVLFIVNFNFDLMEVSMKRRTLLKVIILGDSGYVCSFLCFTLFPPNEGMFFNSTITYLCISCNI